MNRDKKSAFTKGERKKETEASICKKRAKRVRNLASTEGYRTETETQYFVEGEQTETETKHLHNDSEQKQKPSICRRRVNRDRNPTFTKGE